MEKNSIIVPVYKVEPCLRRGGVRFAWQRIRKLICHIKQHK